MTRTGKCTRTEICLAATLSMALLAGCRSELLPLKPLPEIASLDPAPQEQLRQRHAAVARLLRGGGTEQELLARGYGQLGQVYHTYMELEQARTCYVNARALSPTTFRWVYLLAQVERTLGNYTAATKALEQALALRPFDVPTLVWLAKVELELHHLEGARSRFQQALDVDPRCVGARVGRARVALEVGEFTQAIDDLEKALAEQPQASQIHYALGLAYRSLGEKERAATFFEQASRQGHIPIALSDPLMAQVGALREGAQAYLKRGMMAANRGLFDAAVSEYERALAIDPDRPRVRYNLAAALLKLGRRQEALEQLEQLVERAPDYTLSRLLLAQVLAGDGEDEQAEHHLRRAVELDPHSERVHLALGGLFIDRGRLEDALASYRRARELGPDLVSARLAATVTLMRLERFEQALASAEEDVRTLPGSRQLKMLLARLLATIPEQSRRDGRRALEIANEFVDGAETVAETETLAMALAELGRFGEATRWQRAALEVETADGDFGWIRQRLSLYERKMPCRRPWAARERVTSLPLHDNG